MNINYIDEENNGLNPNDVVENTAPTEEDIFAQQEKARAIEALKAGYAFLGKWLWYYFLLIIPNIVSSFFMMFSEIPICVTIGNIISIAASIANIFILIKLGEYDKNYKLSILFQIPLLVVAVIGTFVFINETEIPLWFAGIELGMVLIATYGIYLEFRTHSFVTATVDPILSDQWKKLWKIMIAAMIVTYSSAFLALIPFLGDFIFFVGYIAFIVVSVLKLNYLHKTAKLFQALSF